MQHGTGKTIVEVVIHEGRNRIVRRLLEHVGHPVTPADPHRGSARSGSASSSPGELRELTRDELGVLLDTATALSLGRTVDAWRPCRPRSRRTSPR